MKTKEQIERAKMAAERMWFLHSESIPEIIELVPDEYKLDMRQFWHQCESLVEQLDADIEDWESETN